ncbi:MAG: hypothetical protein AMXMBFR36_21070 [Acidobacteriota bacterium]
MAGVSGGNFRKQAESVEVRNDTGRRDARMVNATGVGTRRRNGPANEEVGDRIHWDDRWPEAFAGGPNESRAEPRAPWTAPSEARRLRALGSAAQTNGETACRAFSSCALSSDRT